MTPLQQVQHLRDLGPDWDGHGASPIAPAALSEVEAIVAALEPDCLEPLIVPRSNGGIAVEWHTHGLDVELEFDRSGKVTVYLAPCLVRT